MEPDRLSVVLFQRECRSTYSGPVGFDLTSQDRMLVNLPPSHVAGQTEQLMTIGHGGSVAVLFAIPLAAT